MIEIKSFASGSTGNCYWVSDGVTPVLIECGISIQDIKKKSGFRLSEVQGCLISHEHGDHIKSAVDVAGSGIDVYMSEGTFNNYSFGSHRFQIGNAGETINLGSWIIKTFEVEHDAEEPLGFYLASRTGEKLVYITDSYYSKFMFQRLTHVMIECNYALDILNENIKSGRVHPAQKKRLLRSHFSLENVKDFLQANDLSEVKEIWLLHLSSRNSDEERFKREIQELTGKPVYIA
ncbi:MBL fold metallo-hydrolase [Natroniella acetigena]|uniref:MBL fold metallo-hydrolase n=1 Tax=Natroniella acetigena TaxID=52004 RepID=UPI00200A9C03|nr:MBL fold metallo-hydrolase [Natroniella acetigena]MCK8826381.1 MBL fold metallo-hydrolase [Natroniella acetigena]